MNRNYDIWLLPAAVQILADVQADLLSGTSLCLVLTRPDDISGFEEALIRELEIHSSRMVAHVSLSDLGMVSVAKIKKAMGFGVDSAAGTGHLLPPDSFPDVTFLKDFNGLNQEQKKATILALKQWADECQSSSSTKTMCLLMMGNDLSLVSDFGVHLKVKLKYLMGIPSSIELQLLCRTISLGGVITAEEHWREVLVSSLAGNDLDIASLLLEHRLDSMDEIVSVLMEYAESKSWDKELIKARLKGWKSLPRGQEPALPGYIQNFGLLWDQITVYTPEYGEEVHSAGLALLDDQDGLRHRIWRSQALLALPLIDDLRIRLSVEIGKRLDLTPKSGDSEDMGVLEIGYLKNVLEKLPVRDGERKRFLGIVLHARYLRNKIAHLEIISQREYLELWNSCQSVRQMVN